MPFRHNRNLQDDGYLFRSSYTLAQFPAWLQKAIMFLPGTYGTSLVRTHCMGGAFREMATIFPAEYMEEIKKSVDSVLYFFNHKVSVFAAYAVLVGSVLAVLAAYCAVVYVKSRKKQK